MNFLIGRKIHWWAAGVILNLLNRCCGNFELDNIFLHITEKSQIEQKCLPPLPSLSSEVYGLQEENNSFFKGNVQVFQPGLHLTTDFHTLLLPLLYGSSSLCSHRGTGCLVWNGHQNALYIKLPVIQNKEREDGKISAPQVVLHVTCNSEEQIIFSQKDDFSSWQNCFQT